MTKPLFLFVGKSGSGKTTIVKKLESVYGLNAVKSYTTRAQRNENDTDHTFISNEEFDVLKDIIAYTEYNGCKYCATKQQIDDADLYIVDPVGVQTLLNKYKDQGRQIVVFYLETNIKTRIDRMHNRGDCDTAVLSRIYNDEEYDWYSKLNHSVNSYNFDKHKDNAWLIRVNANKNEKGVFEIMKGCIDSLKEGWLL